MNKRDYQAIGYAIKERLKMYCQLLGLNPDDLKQESLLTSEQIESLDNGVIDNNIVIRILFVLRNKYGVNLDRLLCGTGCFFSFKGEGVSEEFYRQHKYLFSAREKPVLPVHP
jgi:hypothetical protein